MRLVPVAVLLLTTAACGFLPKPKDPTPPTPTQTERLQELRILTSWSERVEGSATNDPDGDHSIGDSLLFDGLLCQAGVQESCAIAKEAQDESGRWWRARYWVGKEYGSGSVFSRDMALGALLYAQATRDVEALRRWEGSLSELGDGLCPPPESNCSITPALWSVMGAVWSQLGESPYGPMELNQETWRSLGTEILGTPTGFQLHLKGVSLLLLKNAGKNVQGFANSLVDRQPENPFFQWLAGNWDQAAEKTLQHCPTEKPAARLVWQWESAVPHPRGLQSGGWDCLFMTSMLLM